MRSFFASCLIAATAFAAGSVDSVDQASSRLEQQTAGLPAALRIDFRMRAAQSLMDRHPDLARKFVKLAVDEIKSGKDWHLNGGVLQAFAVAAPSEGVAIVPYLAPPQVAMMAGALARANRIDEALALYRQSLARGDLQIPTASTLLMQLVKEKPAEAAKLFKDVLAAAHFETLDPYETYRFLDVAKLVAPVSKGAAVEAYERIASAAAAPDYGAHAIRQVTAIFQGGAEPVTTNNSRETLLLASGIKLRDLAPDRFEARKADFERWDFAAPLSVKSISLRAANAAPARNDDSAISAISKQMGQIRGLPTDADRSRVVLQLAKDIGALPDGTTRVAMVSSLANVSTEGDLGKEALGAVAATLSQALRDTPAVTADPYIELASLVRFERLPAPKEDPALDAAGSLLTLRQQLHQEINFTLTGMDGKTYSLAALRGRVVLVNFWATWCPPCRKEMPDMEKLYQNLQSKGFVVLAISDEDRDTVAGFEQKMKYTFPILLDPDRKVNTAFNVEGIPKSFLFDREGKLVAQAIDMRTESQFLEMLKLAGM